MYFFFNEERLFITEVVFELGQVLFEPDFQGLNNHLRDPLWHYKFWHISNTLVPWNVVANAAYKHRYSNRIFSHRKMTKDDIFS